jgi:uncharacterized membrane protein
MSDLQRTKKQAFLEFKSFQVWLARHSRKLLWAGFFAHASFFSLLSFFNYRHFLYGDWDLALYNQVFHGFLTGRPFMTLADLPYLGLHAELTMLVFLPFYALIPHPVTLLVLQSIALAAAVFPLFLLARAVINEAMALFFCAVYLLYPALGHINLNEFHPECLLPLLQFTLFYFFFRRDFKKFLIFMFLCLFAKENMALIIMMFGVLSAIQKRHRMWVLWPMVSGFLWFMIYMKVIFPVLSRDQINFNFLYSHMGGSLGAVIGFMVTHPLKVFWWLAQGSQLKYLFYLFFPLGFTSFLSPGILLLALPNLLQHLLSLRLTETSILYYYPAEFMAFIFIAGIFGLRRVLEFFSPGEKKLFRLVLLTCVLCSVFLSPQLVSFLGLACDFDANEARARSCRSLIRAVPEHAGVVATFSFLPELSRRSARIDSFHKVLLGVNYPGRRFTLDKACSYALIDFDDPKVFGDFFLEQENRDNLKSFFSDGSWGAEMALGNAVLFKKGGKGAPILSKTVLSGQEPKPIFIFNDQLALQKINKQDFVLDGQKGVRAAFSWRLLGPASADYDLGLALINGANAVVWKATHPIGYRVYPTLEWKQGELVEETFGFLLPHNLGSGPWMICLLPFDRATGVQARVTGGAYAEGGEGVACFSL